MKRNYFERMWEKREKRKKERESYGSLTFRDDDDELRRKRKQEILEGASKRMEARQFAEWLVTFIRKLQYNEKR